MSIEIQQLKKTYHTYKRKNSMKDTIKSLFNRKKIEVNALKGISLSIPKGELVGFIGPNGAGKSTTLKILSGILYPTAGNVKILGYTPWKERKQYVKNIGAVFGQKSQLMWDIPPEDSFGLNKAIYNIPDKQYRETKDMLVDLLQIAEIINKPTRQLSLGERMKCEFVMAMLHKPQIVFLDEPTIGLDIVTKERIRQFIKAMNASDVTFILTTHDLSDIEHLAERVIIINHGQIMFDASINSLLNYFSSGKTIKVKTHKPLQCLDMNGITIKKGGNGSYDAELHLDTRILPLNRFIESINKKSNINDMSIKEPPIEEIIKKIYQKKTVYE